MIRNNTIVIGLTGSMAAGKSTAAARLRELGAVVIDADQASRRVVEKGQPALAALAARFGPGILDGEGKLDRKAMAALAFTDPAALAALNGILHPAIRAEMERELDRAREAGARVAVLDVPLLFECGYDGLCRESWLVTAPLEARLSRAMARDGSTREAALKRMQAQMPEAQKRALADVILENDGPVEGLLGQVDAQYRRIKEMEE